MTKTINMTRGPLDLPAGQTYVAINVALLDAANNVVQQNNMAPDTNSTTLEVPVGNGWRVRVQNRMSGDVVFGDEVFSAPFDVAGVPVTVQIVTAVTVV